MVEITDTKKDKPTGFKSPNAEFFVEMGENRFRADQVMKWIYHYGCDDFEQMTNVNKALRAKLVHKPGSSAKG